MNTFTNFDAAVTAAEAFRGFVANSIGMQVAELRWGRAGTSGVYVPTVSGAGVDDVSNLLGFANKQTITAGAVLVSFDKYKGSHYVIFNSEQATTEVNLGDEYAERTGAQLAAQVDKDLFLAATNGAANSSSGDGSDLEKADILDAYELLGADNVPVTPRSWVFDPEGHADIMGIPEFIAANQRGDGVSAIVTGQLGTLMGSPVYMSQNLPAVTSLYFYKPSVALGINRDFEVMSGRVPGQFGTTYELSVKYGVKVIDGNGICKIVSY